jgi:protein involved in temperature-dependent protein secretion
MADYRGKKGVQPNDKAHLARKTAWSQKKDPQEKQRGEPKQPPFKGREVGQP